jgi:hypothetical protein
MTLAPAAFREPRMRGECRRKQPASAAISVYASLMRRSGGGRTVKFDK